MFECEIATLAISLHHASISALFRQITLIIGVNDFEFFVGLTVQEGTNKLCVALSLVLECRIVAASISLHLPQGQHNLTIPLRMSISHA